MFLLTIYAEEIDLTTRPDITFSFKTDRANHSAQCTHKVFQHFD